MIHRMSAFAGTASMVSERQPGWIYKPGWDLPLIIFSALLVPLPFLVSWGVQLSGWMNQQQAIDLINITVALLIGGPHLFSTITFTFLDGNFRKRYPWYAYLAFLLPIAVIYMGVFYYRILVTFFFTWASLHVLHQIIYLTDCYRARSRSKEPEWSRFVDYGVLLTALYPIGIYKIAAGEFKVAGEALLYPGWMKTLPVPQLAGAVFGVFLIAWIWKTTGEFRQGRASVPKTLLIGITTVVSFCLPLGSNLDVLFQGYNTWHSFQYLFLLWLINRLRDQRGEISDGLVRRIVRHNTMGPYYLCFLAATGIMVIVTLIVRSITSMSPDRSYFVVVLSVLLMHYYFDHFLFSHPRMIE